MENNKNWPTWLGAPPSGSIRKSEELLDLVNNSDKPKSIILPKQKPADSYDKFIAAMDLFQDTQMAIEEYEELDADTFPKRNSLYIYGIMQTLYCQQDALFELYTSVFVDEGISKTKFFKMNFGNKKAKTSYSVFDIRTHRNRIAGHAAGGRDGELFSLAKDKNTKWHFAYGGYTPKFESFEVDIKESISVQGVFSDKVIELIKKEIEKRM